MYSDRGMVERHWILPRPPAVAISTNAVQGLSAPQKHWAEVENLSGCMVHALEQHVLAMYV